MLNYQHLFYFKTIATEGGIAKAAEKLRLGQPTLSAQLKQLEESIGTLLFERRNRKMILTEAGRAALDYANQIFKLGNELVEVLQDRTIDDQPHLEIGALDSVPKGVVFSLVKNAHHASPNCMVSILEGEGDRLFLELHNHRLDLLLSNFPPPLSEHGRVYAKLIARLPVAVFGTKSFLNRKKDYPQSLADTPMILPTSHSKLRHDIEHYFQLKGVKLNVVAETQDSSLQMFLAMQGMGLAPLSEINVKSLKQEESLRKIGVLKGVYEEIWVISAHRRLENPVAAALMKSFTLG